MPAHRNLLFLLGWDSETPQTGLNSELTDDSCRPTEAKESQWACHKRTEAPSSSRAQNFLFQTIPQRQCSLPSRNTETLAPIYEYCNTIIQHQLQIRDLSSVSQYPLSPILEARRNVVRFWEPFPNLLSDFTLLSESCFSLSRCPQHTPAHCNLDLHFQRRGSKFSSLINHLSDEKRREDIMIIWY